MGWLSPQDADTLLKLSVATVCGGLIGLEREIHGKVAGFRTHALVCLGAALFMIVSIDIYYIFRNQTQVDPSRIAAQVVSGIGFLGAGAIIRFPTGITGLTTAASLWAASAIGLACGAGFYRPALAATAMVLVVLFVFGQIGRMFGWKDV